MQANLTTADRWRIFFHRTSILVGVMAAGMFLSADREAAKDAKELAQADAEQAHTVMKPEISDELVVREHSGERFPFFREVSDEKVSSAGDDLAALMGGTDGADTGYSGYPDLSSLVDFGDQESGSGDQGLGGGGQESSGDYYKTTSGSYGGSSGSYGTSTDDYNKTSSGSYGTSSGSYGTSTDDYNKTSSGSYGTSSGSYGTSTDDYNKTSSGSYGTSTDYNKTSSGSYGTSSGGYDTYGKSSDDNKTSSGSYSSPSYSSPSSSPAATSAPASGGGYSSGYTASPSVTPSQGTSTVTASPAAAALTPDTPIPAKNNSVVGQRFSSFLDVFKFDIDPEWVTTRWENVASVGPLHTRGYRVALVTGTDKSDLVGSLTYYFDARLEVEKITFEGYTGDLDRLIIELRAFHMARRLTSDPSLLIYESPVLSNNFRSYMKSYYRTTNIDDKFPNRRYWVTMELYSPEIDR